MRFEREVVRSGRRFGAEPMRGLRFQQTLRGLRVLWSEIDVAVTRGTVQSISATVVPLRSRRLSGERRIAARRARRIARGAIAGAGVVRRPELVAYAGEPGRTREARRAYVVEVYEAEDAHSETAWCVVVDAENGRVLKTWRGFAARPPAPAGDPSPGNARAAAAKTVLLQFVDAGGRDVIVTPNYLDMWTTGTVFRPYAGWRTPLSDKFGTPTQPAVNTLAQTYLVAQHVCVVRDFCGRDSGRDRSYNRHFVTANWVGRFYAMYQHSTERIYLSPAVGANEDSGTIAHEFGHQTDLRNRNDYLSTTEGEEVEEALADMFGYDFERDSKDGVPISKPSIKKVLADPSRFRIDGVALPERQADYNCTAGLDEHINGKILGHAYYRVVERLGQGNPALLGHPRAGAILQHVPLRLPARRTFGAVRVAFEQIAGELFGSVARAHVSAAFADVGVTAASNRSLEC